MKAGWKLVTGDEPPSPTDPDTPVLTAMTWALASGVGVGVTQLLTQRIAARHWQKEIGNETPKRWQDQGQISEPSKHHLATRSGPRGGVLSRLTAPNQPGTFCAPAVAATPGHAAAGLGARAATAAYAFSGSSLSDHAAVS